MRKIITGGVAVALGFSALAAGGAFAGGNGAQHSGLSPMTGSGSNQCVEGSGAETNGFVLVNAPGKPGSARFVNGEVSLKNDPAGAASYTVWIVSIDNSNNHTCVPDGTLTTNAHGNGNAHLATAGTSGTYYVVLQDAQGNEAFASQHVTAN